MKRPVRDASVVALVVASLTLAACSGGGGSTPTQDAGGTFSLGVYSDPGNLDPQRAAQQANIQIASLAYNPLVILDLEGKLQPSIATDWEAVDAQTWNLTIRDDVKCSDGTTLDAQVVADNINYVADPDGGSGFGGFTVPNGASATADGNTVTIALTAPQPFLLENLALLPMVCAAGLEDRDSLATETNGTGPYQASKVAPGDSITYTLRDDYTPGLAGGDSDSLPEEVVVKVITNQTTLANLILSGELNAGIVRGSDVSRLDGADLYTIGYNNLSDQIYLNHEASHLTSEEAVRQALVMALDMDAVIAADTANMGSPATGMLATPKICPGDNIKGNLPAADADGAAELLTGAGWTQSSDGKWENGGNPVTLTLGYSSDSPTASNAAETIASQWEEFGVKVELVGKPTSQFSGDVLGAKFDWDVILFNLGFSTPTQTTPFLSGDAPAAGTNIGDIQNAEFNELTQQALTQPGTTGCDDWNAAEQALYRSADVVPTGEVPFNYYGNGATFQISRSGQLLAGTIELQ